MKERKWYIISAKDKVLGRLATRAAVILMGKTNTDFSRHEDKGDFLIVTDAEKVKVTGGKEQKKTYFKASQYPGNSKIIDYAHIKKNNPEYIVHHAVKGMLPKNKLGSRMITRLKIYAGGEHPHAAQNPETLET
ncbi:MAG: 50S ribosomal protein L13 [Elusimicrobiota bacterium]